MSYLRLYALSQVYGVLTFFVLPGILKALAAQRGIADKNTRVAGYAAAVAVGGAASIVLYEKYGIVFEDTGKFSYGSSK